MIKKLKIKLLFLVMISLFVLLSLILTGINVMSFNSVTTQADNILVLLSHNKGAFPDPFKGPKDKEFPKHMSPETPYESRFFTVLIDDSYEVINTNTSKIISIDSAKAREYAVKALSKNKEFGFVENFRYICCKENSSTMIIFLDCGRQMDSFKSFLLSSILMSAIGYITVFIIITLLSERIIKPISESYEKQIQFITDAGHEIKTPLTIINANADVLEAEVGYNEAIKDIKLQTNRLSDLTKDLVYLAKLEETENRIEHIDFPLTEIVIETIDSFKALAVSKNIILSPNIEPMVTFKGDPKSIEQLIAILMDNAVKYSSPETDVIISLTSNGKIISLCISNKTDIYIDNDKVTKVFDRFYRMDSSRNSETGGHGIGLSIAKAIVNKHNGKIKAYTNDNYSFTIEVILPK